MGIEQLKNARIEGNTLYFDGELVLEGSWGSRDIGFYKNRMEFTACKDRAGQAYIEWEYGQDSFEDDGYEEIGLSFNVNKELIDYDGVMSFPLPAIVLLEHLGYNCDYVKDE